MIPFCNKAFFHTLNFTSFCANTMLNNGCTLPWYVCCTNSGNNVILEPDRHDCKITRDIISYYVHGNGNSPRWSFLRISFQTWVIARIDGCDWRSKSDLVRDFYSHIALWLVDRMLTTSASQTHSLIRAFSFCLTNICNRND